MSWMGAWKTPDLWEMDFDWDILPSPIPAQRDENGNYVLDGDGNYIPRPGAKSTVQVGSVGLAVSSSSQEKEGAYKLAEFLTLHPTGQRLNYQLGQAIPNLIDMANGEFLSNEGFHDEKFPDAPRPQSKQVYLDMVEHAQRRPWAYTPSDSWWTAFWNNPKDELNVGRIFDNSRDDYIKTIWNEDTNTVEGNFLKDIENAMQIELDKDKDKYEWAPPLTAKLNYYISLDNCIDILN